MEIGEWKKKKEECKGAYDLKSFQEVFSIKKTIEGTKTVDPGRWYRSHAGGPKLPALLFWKQHTVNHKKSHCTK